MENKPNEFIPRNYAEDEWQILDSYGEELMEFHIESDDLTGLNNNPIV